MTYALDVLRYVPFVSIGAGGAVIGGGGVDPGWRSFIELGVGLDVIESPTFSWGVAARFDSFASQVAYFAIGPRVSWRWGYF